MDKINPIFNEEELEENKKKTTESIASSGTDIFGGYLFEEYLGAIKEPSDRYNEYERMLRSNPTIFMCFFAAVSQLSSSKWSFEIMEEFADDPAAEGQLEAVRKVFPEEKLRPLVRAMIDVLKNGYYVGELWFKQIIVEGEIKLCPKVETLLPRSIRQWATEGNELIGIRQEAYGDNTKNIWLPINKIVHMAIFAEANNFEGISLMRPCYGPYIRQNVNFKKVAIGNHNLALPFLKITRTDNNSLEEEDKKAFETDLRRRAKGNLSHIVFPYGFDASEENTSFDPKKLYESNAAEDTNIVRAWLANFLLLTRGSGSHALSESLSDFYLEGLESFAAQIEDTLNKQILAPTLELNYDAVPMVRITHTPVGGKAGGKLAEAINKLFTGGAITRDDAIENFIRKKYEFPEIVEDGRDRDAPPEPPAPIEEPDANDPPAMFSVKSQKKQAARAQKRISNLKKVFQIEYDEALKSIVQQKMGKVIKYLKKNQGTQSLFKIRPSDFEVSTKAALKGILNPARNSFLDEYDDTRTEFKQTYAIKKTPNTYLALMKGQIETDFSDIIAKIDLVILSEILGQLNSTDDYIAITGIVADKANKQASEMAIKKASVIPSQVVNSARQAVYDEFQDEIESYTFFNPDPQVDICTYLAGKTIDANSPDARDYVPPFHYNCSTVRMVNLKSFKDSPEAKPLTPTLGQVSTIDFGVKAP